MVVCYSKANSLYAKNIQMKPSRKLKIKPAKRTKVNFDTDNLIPTKPEPCKSICT